MNGKSITFEDKKNEKSNFYKNKKMAQNIHLNTSLDIMIMMSLDHYA